MHCPKCSYPIHCNCKSCIDRVPPGYIAAPSHEELTTIDGMEYSIGITTCPNCGYENSDDGWLDIEWAQMKEEEK